MEEVEDRGERHREDARKVRERASRGLADDLNRQSFVRAQQSKSESTYIKEHPMV